ncbi:MAG TPA: alpha/beta family hydrolase [Vicinamibacterales bacterium]|nr:alpha/beta family hydrolase [Vicinamibacterales bacterium]
MSPAPAATWRIETGGALQTTATWDPPTAFDSGAVFLCAHGAGGHMGDRAMLAVSGALRERGIGVVRFNFFYRARGSGRPDQMPRLVECLSAVVDAVNAELTPQRLILGGRSMGGRAASVAVSAGMACERLLLLAYPLHPPGQTARLRVAHLGAVQQPVLCMNGTRDTFCGRPLMEKTLATLGSNWRMHWLEGADHGFHVLKRTGRTDADILREAADTCREWLG